MNVPKPLDSMRDAVLTVSPNKQYRGIFKPTTPATTGPRIICFMGSCCDIFVEKALFQSFVLLVSNDFYLLVNFKVFSNFTFEY